MPPSSGLLMPEKPGSRLPHPQAADGNQMAGCLVSARGEHEQGKWVRGQDSSNHSQPGEGQHQGSLAAFIQGPGPLRCPPGRQGASLLVVGGGLYLWANSQTICLVYQLSHTYIPLPQLLCPPFPQGKPPGAQADTGLTLGSQHVCSLPRLSLSLFCV